MNFKVNRTHFASLLLAMGPIQLLRCHILVALALGVTFLSVSIPEARAAGPVTQTVTLNPGWNAVSFHVLPPDPDPNAVFNRIDVDSVWAFDSGFGRPDFIQDVSEPALAKAGWRSWVPAGRQEAFQNDLFRIQIHRPYLVKINGTTPVPLTLSGLPSLRSIAWQPDAFNFRGLPIDPAAPPTFAEFFGPSQAHYSGATGLEPIYRLTPAGAWQRVAPTDLAEAGKAYWVYCRGGSDYVAPLRVKLDFGQGLDFRASADELGVELRNESGSLLNVTVRDLGAPAPNPLSRAVRLAEGTLTWPQLESPMVRPVPANGSVAERIAVRRAAMTADTFTTVLEITDGVGSRFLVPVSATRTPTPAAALASAAGRGTAAGRRLMSGRVGLAAVPEVFTHTGLWLGTAMLNAVSEAHSGALTTNETIGFTIQLETNLVSRVVTTNRIPNRVTRTSVSMTTTPTGIEFPLRLLLHVDATGQTRLLKEVIQLWKNGTTTNNADGFAVVDRPGHEVLVTDDSLIGQFVGLTTRDGVAVGRRLSTVDFDFPENELPLAGDFAIGSAVKGTNTLSETFARNPFKHRYHPDHQRGYEVRRVVEMTFSEAPTNAPPGYGERILEGLYRETITGLHRTNIAVAGSFRLTRVSTAAELNPQP